MATIRNRPATVKAKLSNGTKLLAGVDGRSTAARRFRDLIAAISADLSAGTAPSTTERGMIRQAAALTLRAEQLQAAIVLGEPVDGDELIRLSGEARRILAMLRKRARPKDHPTLPDYLAARGTAT